MVPSKNGAFCNGAFHKSAFCNGAFRKGAYKQHVHKKFISHFRATLRGKSSGSLEHTVVYPPNGVIPFHGFAMFCAPFCYVYDETVQMYLCKILLTI